MSMGTPGGLSTYQPAIANLILQEIACGEKSLRRIAADHGVTHWAVLQWRLSSPDFAHQYAEAKRIQAEANVDRIGERARKALALARDCDDPKRANALVNAVRLEVDTYKWAASKLLPKVYGERMNVEHSIDSSLAAALTKARKRTTKRRKLKELPAETIPDAEIIETATESTPHTLEDGVAGVE